MAARSRSLGPAERGPGHHHQHAGRAGVEVAAGPHRLLELRPGELHPGRRRRASGCASRPRARRRRGRRGCRRRGSRPARSGRRRSRWRRSRCSSPARPGSAGGAPCRRCRGRRARSPGRARPGRAGRGVPLVHHAGAWPRRRWRRPPPPRAPRPSRRPRASARRRPARATAGERWNRVLRTGWLMGISWRRPITAGDGDRWCGSAWTMCTPGGAVCSPPRCGPIGAQGCPTPRAAPPLDGAERLHRDRAVAAVAPVEVALVEVEQEPGARLDADPEQPDAERRALAAPPLGGGHHRVAPGGSEAAKAPVGVRAAPSPAAPAAPPGRRRPSRRRPAAAPPSSERSASSERGPPPRRRRQASCFSSRSARCTAWTPFGSRRILNWTSRRRFRSLSLVGLPGLVGPVGLRERRRPPRPAPRRAPGRGCGAPPRPPRAAPPGTGGSPPRGGRAPPRRPARAAPPPGAAAVTCPVTGCGAEGPGAGGAAGVTSAAGRSPRWSPLAAAPQEQPCSAAPSAAAARSRSPADARASPDRHPDGGALEIGTGRVLDRVGERVGPVKRRLGV